MCVVCRSRLAQSVLLRFCVRDGLVASGFTYATRCGRSFYVCRSCAVCEKRVLKALSRFSAIKDTPQSLQIIQEMAKYE
ncbi:DUF448 domain-containing protein [Helicobacter zhangjianzhongii]